ncbi:PAS domain-containing protein [Qipengyuania gelatinilytica]|uniref:PAS domain-containing protein n=1 Tax=Qipengyuania gelatinilytica TaxID=2867231 RepID=A0ABX9A0F1_9SPHN|nr:PAS domain-containing protein [Qipengyuania gelatinilytica]QZD94705.1 PAS domain-containing protein [Qipengyuania gelatinilytica]
MSDLFRDSKISLSLADYTRDDCPLIGINARFAELSGYSASECLGRNCRFLQPEGGAGPVRERMRAFLHEEEKDHSRFVVPNVRKDGTPFLNLLYMSKLQRDGRTALILGSQFDISRANANDSEIYDRALHEDLINLKLLTEKTNWSLVTSLEALASSHAIIAQARIDP